MMQLRGAKMFFQGEKERWTTPKIFIFPFFSFGKKGGGCVCNFPKEKKKTAPAVLIPAAGSIWEQSRW